MEKPVPTKILITRLSALGDVILTLPVLAQLRQCYPQATIGWLVEADAAILLKGSPDLDYVHISHRKRWLKSLKNPRQWRNTFQEVTSFIQELKAVDYEVVIDIQGLFKSAIWGVIAGIKRRVGFSCAREMAFLFYTDKVTPTPDFFDPETPIIEHFMALVRDIGCEQKSLQYPLPPLSYEICQQAMGILEGLNENKPLVVLAPATQWESKHWPMAYWQTLIAEILSKTDVNLVVIGGKKDQTLCDSILESFDPVMRQGRLLNLTGKTSLEILQALFEKIDILIGLDSAPLHLAGAVGKAHLVGIYGPTSSHRSRPPNPQKAVLLSSTEYLACQPCDEKKCPLKTTACMQHVTPEQVFSSFLKLLNAIPKPSKSSCPEMGQE